VAPASSQHSRVTRGAILKRLLAVAVAGVALYGLAPRLVEVLGDWPRLHDIEPGWLAVMAVSESASLVCMATVQRIATGEHRLGPKRLLDQRTAVVKAVGHSWWQALLAAAGKWLFDYLTLVFALAAVGARPSAALVLVAYSAISLLGQLPVTPGGLGVVEAGLTCALALIGVNGGDAVLATLAYRLFNYWLYLPAGLVGLILHRRAVRAPQAQPG
jgi:hypothetical protein